MKKNFFFIVLVCAVFSVKSQNKVKKHINTQNQHVIDSLKEQGDDFVISGQYSKAIKNYFNALKLSELKKDTFLIISIYNNIGTAYNEIEDYENAALFIKKAEELINNETDNALVADVCNTIANSYYNTYQDSLALLYFKKSNYFRLKTNDSIKLASSFNNLAAFYLDMKDFDKGEEMMQQAINIRVAINDSSGIASSYLALGESYLLSKEYKMAKIYLEKGKAYVLKNTNIHTKLMYLEDFTLLYSDLNDYKNAFKYQSLLLAFKDSILTTEKSKQILEVQTKYEVEKKDLQLQLQQTTIKEQQEKSFYIKLFFAFILIFVLLIVLVLYLHFKHKQKIKTEIEKIETENLRKQAELEAKEKERNRLAAELHDNVGSSVSFMSLKLDKLIEQDGTNKEIAQLKETAQDVISGLRETLWTLNTKSISNIDLCDKLKVYIKKHLFCSLKINDQLNHEFEIPNEDVLTLYRCSQEIINNINKHSNAKTVVVQFISLTNNELTMIFSDDGVGFNFVEKDESYGLRNLKARVDKMNGEFSVKSSLGNGTEIKINYKISA